MHRGASRCLRLGAIEKCRVAQNNEWTSKINDIANFDVDSTEDIDSLQQAINSLNSMLNDISNEDNQKLIFNDPSNDSKASIDSINDQINRHQTRIDDIGRAKQEAEEKAKQESEEQARQEAAAAASSSNYASSNGSSSSAAPSGGKTVIAWRDCYDGDGKHLGRTEWYSDGTCNNPWAYDFNPASY